MKNNLTDKLTDIEIIKLGYITMETISSVLGKKIFLEQINCYRDCYFLIQRLFKTIEITSALLKKHKNLIDFYNTEKVLLGDEILYWGDRRIKLKYKNKLIIGMYGHDIGVFICHKCMTKEEKDKAERVFQFTPTKLTVQDVMIQFCQRCGKKF